MRTFLLCAVVALLFTNCNKRTNELISKVIAPQKETTSFLSYRIKQGGHYSDLNDFSPIETTTLKFLVRFDSSAIYTSKEAINQYDINKLYGFSDNNAHHHQYSARFGWSWTNNALHLYAYVYNEGVVLKEDLGIVALNAEISCSIEISAATYKFKLNDRELYVPRKSTTTMAKGYKLYPYFGGDEAAPHDITIQIKNL